MSRDRFFLLCAALAGFTGVAIGAFGAHALKSRVSIDLLAVFETGVRYQMYHAFALVAAAWGCARFGHKAFTVAGWMFVLGIVIFSGSLYVLALSGVRWLGAITPFGGLAFLTGWACLFVGALRGVRPA